MHLSHVVVDGSNIATEGRDLPSLHQLDEAVRAFLTENQVDNITVIVDATFGHRIDASERAEYEEAILAQELTTPPAGAVGRGDAFVLSIADRANATILSNDSFQEFHGQYPWLFDDGRIIGGKPVPGVGWVFVPRVPVRGPISRKAVREARSGKATIPGSTANRRRRRGRGERATEAPKAEADTAAAPQLKAEATNGRRRSRRRSAKPPEPVNDFLPFIEFVGEHPVGAVVEGTVDVFSSHGAYIHVGEVACYLPLKLMADPPPRSARDVLTVGETRRFVVHELDPPRRSVDLSMLALTDETTAAKVSAAPKQATKATTKKATKRARARQRGERRGDSRQDVVARGGGAEKAEVGSHLAARDVEQHDDIAVAAKPNTDVAVVATTTSTTQHAEEAPVTPVKKAAKKAAKKAPARKAAKKTVKKTAKKAAKRAPARKAAKKATKKAAKKATKKAPARKAAKKATKKAVKKTAKKATKKAPARKAAKKATKKATRKAPARKR